jgi:hypothetical protein
MRISLVLAGVILAAAATPSWGSPDGIDRVEEDWEVVIESPSPMEAGPQITTTMSPFEDRSRLFFAFNLNYRDNPFYAGGLQVHAYANDQTVARPDAQKSAQCDTPGETILWTQRLSIVDGTTRFEVRDGSSTTWNVFGQGDNLQIDLAWGMTNLDAYTPNDSVRNSGVSWQSNRVRSLTLREVRTYRGGTLLTTDSTPRAIPVGPQP